MSTERSTKASDSENKADFKSGTLRDKIIYKAKQKIVKFSVNEQSIGKHMKSFKIAGNVSRP